MQLFVKPSRRCAGGAVERLKRHYASLLGGLCLVCARVNILFLLGIEERWDARGSLRLAAAQNLSAGCARCGLSSWFTCPSRWAEKLHCQRSRWYGWAPAPGVLGRAATVACGRNVRAAANRTSCRGGRPCCTCANWRRCLASIALAARRWHFSSFAISVRRFSGAPRQRILQPPGARKTPPK